MQKMNQGNSMNMREPRVKSSQALMFQTQYIKFPFAAKRMEQEEEKFYFGREIEVLAYYTFVGFVLQMIETLFKYFLQMLSSEN